MAKRPAPESRPREWHSAPCAWAEPGEPEVWTPCACPSGPKKPKKVKVAKAPAPANPCLGATLRTERIPSEHWALRLDFVPSAAQLLRYCEHFGYAPIVKRDEDNIPRATFDDAAMTKLMEKYPKDRLFPLVARYRQTEKALGKDLDLKIIARDGRVHTEFGHLPSTGRLSSKRPNMQNCYSADTEILTTTGWVPFPQVTLAHQVAQWHSDGTIDFTQPSRIVSHVADELIQFSGDAIDMCVTPEHVMVSQGRTGRVYRDTAESWLKPRQSIDRKVIRAGRRAGGRRLTTTGRRDLQIAILVQSEGHILPGKVRRWAKVTLKSERKQRQLLELFPEGTRRTGAGLLTIKLALTDSWAEWISWPEKGLRVDKILELCAEDLDLVVQEAMRWDGDYTRGHSFGQHIRRVSAVDAIELAAILTGRSTKRAWLRQGTFSVTSVHHKAARYASRLKVARVPYTGHVYCVTVPSGAVVVRRNQRVLVCGNCPRTSDVTSPYYKVREVYTAAPGHRLIEADFGGIEGVLTMYLAAMNDDGTPKANREDARVGLRLTGIDIHGYISSHDIGQPADPNWSDGDLRAYLKQFRTENREWTTRSGRKMRYEDIRDCNKTGLYASLYGGGPSSLVRSRPEVFPEERFAAATQRLILDETFPSIRAWQWEVVREADARGYVRTPDGYRQYFFDALERRWSKRENRWKESLGKTAKEVIAAKPQHLAFCYTAQAIGLFWERYPHLRDGLRLTIHDSIVGEWPDDVLRAEAVEALLTCMATPLECLPLPAEWGMGAHLAIKAEAKWSEIGGNWRSMGKVTL